MRCSRDKTRCDSKAPHCTRCKEKGVDCHYKNATPRDSRQSEDAGSLRTQRQGKDVAPASWPKCSDVKQVALPFPSSRAGSSISPDQFDNGGRDTDLALSDGWELDSSLFENMDFEFGSTDSQDSELTGLNSLFSSPSLTLPVMRSFGIRSTVTPTQRPVVSIIMQLLRSYPYMLLRKETFPPVVSPLLYSWAEKGEGPPQETLINCVSLVQMFKMRTAANRKFVWNLIRLEQERIWSNVRLSQHLPLDLWLIS